MGNARGLLLQLRRKERQWLTENGAVVTVETISVKKKMEISTVTVLLMDITSDI